MIPEFITVVEETPYNILTLARVRPYFLPANQFDLPAHSIIVGIDPGNHKMGITIMPTDVPLIICGEINMTPERDPAKRPPMIYEVVYRFLTYYREEPEYHFGRGLIEGASFGDKFRQVELAEARTAALMALDDLVKDIQILPPLSIRKQVFGNGKIRGEDMWKYLLPPNAASSLVCALCAANLIS